MFSPKHLKLPRWSCQHLKVSSPHPTSPWLSPHRLLGAVLHASTSWTRRPPPSHNNRSTSRTSTVSPSPLPPKARRGNKKLQTTNDTLLSGNFHYSIRGARTDFTFVFDCCLFVFLVGDAICSIAEDRLVWESRCDRGCLANCWKVDWMDVEGGERSSVCVVVVVVVKVDCFDLDGFWRMLMQIRNHKVVVL